MAKDRNEPMTDALVALIRARSAHGIATYGKPLDAAAGDLRRWLRELQEELLDAVFYIERALVEMEKTDA